MKKIFFPFLCALILIAGSAFAADDPDSRFSLTHHIDLWQMGTNDGHVKSYDLSYHFTLFEYDRFSFGGAGLGVDVWTTCPVRNCGADSVYRRYFGSPFAVVPLVSIRLTKKSEDGWLSLGTNYVYQFRNKDHALTAGFMVSWQ